MSISFFGMDMAISGLNANQKAMEVVGHNVANLGTVGFSRQSVVMASAYPRSYGNWKVEMGVNIQQIRQIRHDFNDNIYRTESNGLGYWESRSKAIKDVEAIIAEPIKDGVQVSMNKFWDSWQELSKAPESLTIRALVKQRADTLVEHLNHVGAQLDKLQSDLNSEIKSRINEVNDITKDIADLNVKIMSAEAAGNLPNDYYDQRNVLADRLSMLVDCETWVGQEGNMDILVGGYFLVSKGVQTKLVAAPNDDLSSFYVPKVEGTNMEIKVGSGIIKGLLEARGEVSGAKGNFDNGTPNTTADITIAVDVSNTTAGYLANVKANIEKMATDLKNRGINYNLRLVTFGNGAITNTPYGTNAAALAAALPSTPQTDAGYVFSDVINSVASQAPMVPDANRYMMVFTGESINGDSVVAGGAAVDGYVNTLKQNGIHVSVIGDATKIDAGESPWTAITGATDGKFYDINSADYPGLMTKISGDVNSDVNMRMSTVPANLNLISSVKKQLNALINIMAREVNYLHLSGKTLTGNDGGAFFEPIDAGLPIQIGNIRTSTAIKDLNNIVASITDANGDNKIALAIANLRNVNLMTGNDKILSLDTYYQNVLLDIGNKGYEADIMADSHRQLVEQADNVRQSVMGVSLDEEMTNMIKYKYAYNANSKMIEAVNSMLETVIFRLGKS